MNVSEWQKRLEDTFSKNGVIGPRLLDILNQELDYGNYVVNTFHGYSVLQDCFFDFLIESIQRANQYIHENGIPKEAEYYRPTLLSHIANFRNFRAAENLLMKGYPLDGYALLRDLKDRSVYQSAIMHGITSYKNRLSRVA
ncbi:hypothetical protein BMS3Abin15_01161 [bacterium BMS3Abin15]|nr:hypothetical protein BMS3Abin15_01161 [bacterium BMS3Abin15]